MTVAPDELTGTEQAVLLVLMAECRPVPNPELKDLGPTLDLASRNRLRAKGLIDVSSGRPMVLELTDDGWAVCRSLFGADVPARPSGQGKALYTLMKALHRHFERADLALADVFGPADEAPAASTAAQPAAPEPDAESMIREAYAGLVGSAGDWLGLARLRARLDGVARDDVDAALVRLYQRPGVHLIPEENQKVLTDDDRDAAVLIGRQHKHLIAIES